MAWPLAQWGLIHEGGVCVGDTNIGCNHMLDPSSHPAPAIRAIALDPSGGPDELDRLGITYSEAMSSPELPDDPRLRPWNEGWTNRLLFGWRPGLPVAFLCEYHHDVQARRTDDVRRLNDTGGGRLGITRLRELIVETTVPDADTHGWDVLLGRPTQGPTLRLEAGGRDRYAALVFEVASVTRATAALDDLGIAHDDGEGVRLDPSGTLGLDIRLVGRPA